MEGRRLPAAPHSIITQTPSPPPGPLRYGQTSPLGLIAQALLPLQQQQLAATASPVQPGALRYGQELLLVSSRHVGIRVHGAVGVGTAAVQLHRGVGCKVMGGFSIRGGCCWRLKVKAPAEGAC